MFYIKFLILLGALSIEAALNVGSVTSKIGYEFEDQTHLRQSFSVGTPEFRKLELLGDGVLYKTLTEYLYSSSHDAHEIHSQREKYKTNLALSRKFVELGLVDDLNHFWQGPSGTNKNENYAATLEALIGAIQYDGGDASSKKFIYKIFDFKTPKKGKRSKAAREGKEQITKKPKKKGATIKANPKAPKLLSDILYLPQDKQIKKYGKKYLNHRYVELKRDTGLYAIEAFLCYYGGATSLELHRVEAKSLAAAKELLATWAIENLEAFSETSFYRGLAKHELASSYHEHFMGFLANQTYAFKYLIETNKNITKEYCRHRFKKIGEDIILEAYPRSYPSYTKEMYRLVMTDESEARLALVEWMLDHLDLFMIDSRLFYENEFLVSNGFVKTHSEIELAEKVKP